MYGCYGLLINAWFHGTLTDASVWLAQPLTCFVAAEVLVLIISLQPWNNLESSFEYISNPFPLVCIQNFEMYLGKGRLRYAATPFLLSLHVRQSYGLHCFFTVGSTQVLLYLALPVHMLMMCLNVPVKTRSMALLGSFGECLSPLHSAFDALCELAHSVMVVLILQCLTSGIGRIFMAFMSNLDEALV